MWNGVVTNLGLSLLEQWAAGSETLYIDKATAGSGTVAQSNMRGSTYVQGEVGDVSIVASIPVTGGTQYRIQVSANPDAAYIMHQIGIWAHLGASGGTTLLALYQDEDGVSVPLEADDPGFGFTLYAVVSMSNQGSVSVNFDGGAYVTRDDFSSALAGYVKTVNENGPNSDGNVTLPVDATPTSGSTNPVSSDGVFDALAGKQATLTFDSTPTSGSTNPVTSGGVYTGLDGKQDKLTLPLAIAQGGTGAVTQEQAIYDLMAYAPYITKYISTEDLNNLTHSGFYQVSSVAANEPNAVPHFVISLTNADGTRRTQFAWRSTGNTTTDSAYTIYMRKYVDDTWGAWRVVRTPGTALTIAEGGTGATTAAAALANLGAAPTVQCPNGTDADTLKNAGLYMIASDGVNLPNSAINGYILVISSTDGTRSKQLFSRHGTQNTNDFQTYVRQWNGSTWSDWVRLIDGATCIPWQSTTTWSTAVADAKMDIKVVFEITEGSNIFVATIDIPVAELTSSYKYFFSAFHNGTDVYAAQIRARTSSSSNANAYKNNTQLTSGVATHYLYR